MAACTDNTRALSVTGRLSPNQLAQAPNSVRIKSHKSIEPSWFPQTPATL